MKKLYQYMMILMAGVLGACGSMSVDNDPYAEALPADFNPQEYMALHPELSAQQYKDFVTEHNSKVKVDNDSKAADKAAFAANLEAVGLIYTHPLMEAHSLEEWAQLVANLSLPDSSTEHTDAQNKIDKLIKNYNLDDTTDDFNVLLSSVQIDYFAISQQFTVFGRDHGWVYRLCRSDEAALPVRDPVQFAERNKISNAVTVDGSFVPDNGFYCRDALGNDHLIQ